MFQIVGQHLLSAIAEGPQFSFETVSWAFGVEKSYVELAVPENRGPPTAEELSVIEKTVNELIRQRIPITIHSFTDTTTHQPTTLPHDLKTSGATIIRYVAIGHDDKDRIDYNA